MVSHRSGLRSVAAALRVALLAVCCVFPGAQARDAAGERPGGPVEVRASKVSFGGGKRLGRLTYRGGLHLTSPSPDFGGFSGLALDEDGKLMAVSDAGMWLTAEVIREDGRLTAVTNARMGRILDQNGRPYRSKWAQDAEALRAEADGTFLIAFENRHRVGRYRFEDGELRLIRYLNVPSATRAVRGNRGLEAVTTLRGGKEFVFLAERLLDDDGNHTGWHVKDGKVRRLRIERSDEFDITDVATLPDNGLILLERRFIGLLDGVHMRLRLITAGELDDADVIRGEELFRGNNFGYAIDNMEGVDVYRTKAGETVIAVISDDNFNRAIQRTLLLEFTLDGDKQAVRQTSD